MIRSLKTALIASASVIALAGGASAFSFFEYNDPGAAGFSVNDLGGDWDDGPVTVFGQTFDPAVDPFLVNYSERDDQSLLNQLSLKQDAKLTFTFLLSEAAFQNESLLFQGSLNEELVFNNKNDAVGDVYETTSLAGLLDFSYCTSASSNPAIPVDDCISNLDGGTNADKNLKIASSKIFIGDDGKETVLFLFGDAGGDKDVSDFVVAVQASAIPLPAGVWLLGTALAGLGIARRKRKS